MIVERIATVYNVIKCNIVFDQVQRKESRYEFQIQSFNIMEFVLYIITNQVRFWSIIIYAINPAHCLQSGKPNLPLALASSSF